LYRSIAVKSDGKRPWYSFEERLARWLSQRESSALQFRNGYQAIPGFPSDGFRADALLTDGRTLLALEIEFKQTHPDTNVGKYWLLADHKLYEKVILVHIFTPGYNSYPWRKTLGEFYADRMGKELPFEYIQLDLRSCTDPETAFRDCVTKVGELVGQAFP
jgi:hypothetical protein